MTLVKNFTKLSLVNIFTKEEGKMREFIDLHSHILPSIDDGAKNMEESKKMLKQAWEEGIREIIATPHFFVNKKNVSKEQILKTISMLEEAMIELGFFIKIYPGNEIYYRSEVEELVEQGIVNTMAGSHYVLVEFDPMAEYSYLRNGILKLVSYGYTPILAHTERYECLFKNKDKLQRIKEHGSLIQVNSATITKGIFDEMGKRGRYLMKKGLLDFISSDSHSMGKRSPRIREAAHILEKKMGTKKAEKILFANPRAVIEDRSI